MLECDQDAGRRGDLWRRPLQEVRDDHPIATLNRAWAESAGISMEEVTDSLLVKGVASFVAALEQLETAIRRKQGVLLAGQARQA